MLSSRMKNILRELFVADQPITGQYLANINQVTPRTIREDIKHLNELLKERGAKVNSVISKGYQLEVSDDQCFRNFLQAISVDQSSKDRIPSTPEERTAYIIKRLLLSNKYIKLDDLADELYVSKSTIQLDLKTVKQILQEYEITLDPKPNYGLKAVGDEIKFRFCLSEYLFHRDHQKRNPIIESEFYDVSQEETEKIYQIIINQIEKHHITLSDIAINNLLIHICIAYKRIINGHYVAIYHNDSKEIQQQKEFQVAKEIAAEVEKAYQIVFPEEEVVYIAMHLLGTKLLSHTSSDLDNMLDSDTFQLVKYILQKVEEQLDLNIKDDEELLLGLRLHLKPALNRIKFGMNIRNPLLADIKNFYPLAYEAGIIAGLAIKEYTGIEFDENEIGYLALHFGAAIERKKSQSGPKHCLVVCASGLGTARFIYYRLKSYFGNNLDVIGTTEYYKLDEINLNDVDFIVSSIPIPEHFRKPVIQVNAVLKEQDLKAIEKFILDENDQMSALSYFKEDLTFLNQKLTSQLEVLDFFNKNLLEQRLVDETFLDAVFEREKVASTAFGNLVAVPHPITPKTTKTFVGVCTLKKPILWNETPVQIVLLLCVKKNSQEDLQEMYDLIGKLIENKTMVQNILKAKTYHEFIQGMKE